MPRAVRGRWVIHPVSRFLAFAYFVEAGLLLLVAPWSVFWERNLFVERVPYLGDVLLDHFVRGGISGVGLICLAAAVEELLGLIGRRAREGGGSPGTS